MLLRATHIYGFVYHVFVVHSTQYSGKKVKLPVSVIEEHSTSTLKEVYIHSLELD